MQARPSGSLQINVCMTSLSLALLSYILLCKVGSPALAPFNGETLAPVYGALVPHVPIVTSSSAAVG